MKSADVMVGYNAEKETAFIYQFPYGAEAKLYNRIRTEGDIGTAVKDYYLELKKQEKDRAD